MLLLAVLVVGAASTLIDREAVLRRNTVKFEYPEGNIDPVATANTQLTVRLMSVLQYIYSEYIMCLHSIDDCVRWTNDCTWIANAICRWAMESLHSQQI